MVDIMSFVIGVPVVAAVFFLIHKIPQVPQRKHAYGEREEKQHRKEVAQFKKNARLIAKYNWIKPAKKKEKPKDNMLKDEKYFAKVEDKIRKAMRATLELYEGGKAVYMYVYGAQGAFKLWLCTYEIADGELILIPYFYKKGSGEEVFGINGNELKYIGNRRCGSDEKPKRELPYSLYSKWEKE